LDIANPEGLVLAANHQYSKVPELEGLVDIFIGKKLINLKLIYILCYRDVDALKLVDLVSENRKYLFFVFILIFIILK